MKTKIAVAIGLIAIFAVVLFYRTKSETCSAASCSAKTDVTATPTLSNETMKAEKVSALQFSAAVKTAEKGQVIDIRTAEEFASGHVKDALNTDFYNTATFEAYLTALDKTKTYYVYCRSGNRSGQSIATFKKLGFTHVVELTGGITAWQSAGLELVKE
jgi:rhodanese-related sulfurtransferase